MSCVKQEFLNIRPHNDVVLKIRYITGFFIALKPGTLQQSYIF